jgi:hypothetical protein
MGPWVDGAGRLPYTVRVNQREVPVPNQIQNKVLPGGLYLPIEQAISVAAYQNMLVDMKNDPDDSTPWEEYVEEATYLLSTTGENYQGQGLHPTIKVKKS